MKFCDPVMNQPTSTDGNVIRCFFFRGWDGCFFIRTTSRCNDLQVPNTSQYHFPTPFPRPPAPKRWRSSLAKRADFKSWMSNLGMMRRTTWYSPCNKPHTIHVWYLPTFACFLCTIHGWYGNSKGPWKFMVGRRFYPFGMAYLQGRTVSFGEIERYHSCWINGVDAGLPSKILQEEWLLPSVARRSFWGQGLNTTVNYTRIQVAHESICKCSITSLL